MDVSEIPLETLTLGDEEVEGVTAAGVRVPPPTAPPDGVPVGEGGGQGEGEEVPPPGSPPPPEVAVTEAEGERLGEGG